MRTFFSFCLVITNVTVVLTATDAATFEKARQVRIHQQLFIIKKLQDEYYIQNGCYGKSLEEINIGRFQGELNLNESDYNYKMIADSSAFEISVFSHDSLIMSLNNEGQIRP